MKRLILPVLLVWLLAGCNTEADRIPPATVTKKAATATPDLNLNNGCKWQADEVTTDCVRNMEQLMHHFFYLQDFSSPEANRELALALQTELQTIYHNCSMTGPSHEALHKFLVPMEQDIGLLQSDNLSEANHARIQLEDRLLTYEDYFENP